MKFTLDDIRAAAEAQYGSTDIEIAEGVSVKLLNPLRMSEVKRKALVAASKRLQDEGEDADQSAAFDEIFGLIAENEGAAKKLIDALGDDLAMKAIIFEHYQEGTQAGEA
jgi:Mycobacteriophage tail assembly protein